MKKFAAILLLCLYTFNISGYQLLFYVIEQMAAQHLQSSLDQEAYAKNNLLTLTVPLSLPYISDTPGFEWGDGEITIEGKIYHYVERGVINGALVLLCLPDHQKMKLERAKANYVDLTGDFQHSKPSKKNQDNTNPFRDIRLKYCPNNAAGAALILPGFSFTHVARYLLQLRQRQIKLPDQPPNWS